MHINMTKVYSNISSPQPSLSGDELKQKVSVFCLKHFMLCVMHGYLHREKIG